MIDFLADLRSFPIKEQRPFLYSIANIETSKGLMSETNSYLQDWVKKVLRRPSKLVSLIFFGGAPFIGAGRI